ncbi:LytTR family transcriptional regulator DNA-binding domain-containing protein [Xanthobacter autotrophicus]|uniref:LytTR family transcriptional regulator DNA-binding domain-containing protein n=1 Tax=Xanthobacter autotrophicus TaxID=280 RepID=UPI0024A6A73E|nr:LytTR family transcriptional regulator DNA-binding domain-containing protein [Xanthobacter autotrophicus]MDI4657809.1 LytTR family transcriptional regulator DNA-binding domain-containing protein [Xanthobacter autotrophicus]
MAETPAARPSAPAAQSFEYRLQRTPVGVVLLDADLTIRSVNPVAMRLLAPPGEKLAGVDILSLHPDEAREKVAFLIDRARTSADGTSSLVVTTAMGSLIAKVSRLEATPGGPVEGFCMMIHALAEAPVMGRARADDADVQVEGLAVAGEAAMKALCPLMKLPLVQGKGDLISLIDVNEVVCLVAQGHYAEARTLAFSAFCPRPLADLERRLDPALFVRVHRRYLVNIRHVRAATREDGAWHLVMADTAQTRVPVSRARVEAIRRLLAV